MAEKGPSPRYWGKDSVPRLTDPVCGDTKTVHWAHDDMPMVHQIAVGQYREGLGPALLTGVGRPSASDVRRLQSISTMVHG
jgi:hypothetical protein